MKQMMSSENVALSRPQIRVLQALCLGADRRLCLAPASRYTWMAQGTPHALDKVATNPTVLALLEKGMLLRVDARFVEITDAGRRRARVGI